MPQPPKRYSGGLGLPLVGLFVIVTWLGWRASKPSATATRPAVTKPAVKVNDTTATGSRSRMIEADPTEIKALPAKDNAANDWRKAFALAEKLTKREQEILKEKPPANPPATDEEIAALLAKIDPIIALIRQGAAKPGCDWGIHALSFGTPLPHLAKAQFLCKVAAFDALQRISTEPAEAMQNLIAMDHLGNSLDQGLVGGLVNAGIHQQIFDFVGLHANSISSLDRQTLQTALDETALAQSLQEGFRTEMKVGGKFIHHFSDRSKCEWSPLTDQEKETLNSLGDPDNFKQYLERSQKMAVILDQMLYMPDDKFQSWVGDFQKKNPGPDETNSLPFYSKIRDTARKTLATQGMTRAGLAVMDEGTAALTRMPDPLTGKPFGYRVVDENGSFELQSEVVNKGKPVTLTFKMPPK